MIETWPLAMPAGALGAVLGSGMATAVNRSGRGVPWRVGRSACDGCGRGLSYLEMTPVLAYAAAGGACTSCRSRIDPLQPAGELAGLVGIGAPFLLVEPVRAAWLAAMALVLLGLSLVDARTLRLPNVGVGVVAALGLGLAAGEGWPRMQEGLIAAGLCLLGLTMFAAMFRRLHGADGLGGGDVKLLGAVALWTGAATPLVLVLAASTGLLWARAAGRSSDRRFAFGPFLAAAAVTVGLAREAGWSPF